MIVYRLLRQDENYTHGLSAKNPASAVSVFDHVLKGSRGTPSKYISTCADLDALNKNYAPNAKNPGNVVVINTNRLPFIDLREQDQRNLHIPNFKYPDLKKINKIEKFNNYATKFQEVLLEGFIPASYIQLV